MGSLSIPARIYSRVNSGTLPQATRGQKRIRLNVNTRVVNSDPGLFKRTRLGNCFPVFASRIKKGKKLTIPISQNSLHYLAHLWKEKKSSDVRLKYKTGNFHLKLLIMYRFWEFQQKNEIILSREKWTEKHLCQCLAKTNKVIVRGMPFTVYPEENSTFFKLGPFRVEL